MPLKIYYEDMREDYDVEMEVEVKEVEVKERKYIPPKCDCYICTGRICACGHSEFAHSIKEKRACLALRAHEVNKRPGGVRCSCSGFHI